jgi:hypothetical protein
LSLFRAKPKTTAKRRRKKKTAKKKKKEIRTHLKTNAIRREGVGSDAKTDRTLGPGRRATHPRVRPNLKRKRSTKTRRKRMC